MLENIVCISLSTAIAIKPRFVLNGNTTTMVLPDKKLLGATFDALFLTANEVFLSPLATSHMHALYDSLGLSSFAALIEYTTSRCDELVVRRFGPQFDLRESFFKQAVQKQVEVTIDEVSGIHHTEPPEFTSALQLDNPAVRALNLRTWGEKKGHRPIVLLEPVSSVPQIMGEIESYAESQVFLLATTANKPAKPAPIGPWAPYVDNDKRDGDEDSEQSGTEDIT